MKNIKLISMYYNNINIEILEKQAQVFQSLGFYISQIEKTGQQHGDFLDDQMKLADENDILIFVDIDCFPLNSKIVDVAVDFAKAGGIWGCSQVSNHLPDPIHQFAAPMFHAISKKTWVKLGEPSYTRDKFNDVAQRVTRVAEQQGVPIYLAQPEFCLLPKFKFADGYPYGVGTFYHGGIFHLFESRRKEFRKIFIQVANSVINKQMVDYLDLVNQAMSIEFKRRAAYLIKTPIRMLNKLSKKMRALL